MWTAPNLLRRSRIKPQERETNNYERLGQLERYVARKRETKRSAEGIVDDLRREILVFATIQELSEGEKTDGISALASEIGQSHRGR